MANYNLNEIEFEVVDGRKRKLVVGEELEFVLVEREAGAGDSHSHPNEQIVYFLEGKATFHIADETHEIEGGHVLSIPKGIQHGITPHTFIRYVTAYSPSRESSRKGVQDGSIGHLNGR